MPRTSTPEVLADVASRIRQRQDSAPPAQAAIDRAAQLLAVRPQTAISRSVHKHDIWHVEDDGKRYMVALFSIGDQVIDAECSCFTQETCPHLLAVLASCGKTLEV
jgi:hypothetical protein